MSAVHQPLSMSENGSAMQSVLGIVSTAYVRRSRCTVHIAARSFGDVLGCTPLSRSLKNADINALRLSLFIYF
jgi:hypothetical protein